jgi:hypothetical protein
MASIEETLAATRMFRNLTPEQLNGVAAPGRRLSSPTAPS